MPTKKDSRELPLPMTDGRGEADPELPLPSPWRPTAWRWSLLALLLGLTATVLVHQQQQRRQDAEQALIHDELARKSYAALQRQLQSAEFLLRAMQTLFLASDTVTATEFHHFYVNLRPRERFPGLLALAYAQREIRPDGEHYITRWIEPLAGNEVLAGLDVGAQPRNFAGLTGSRDSDQATLSAPFQPLQHSPADAADAVTLRLPIFSTGAPPAPVERRARVLGSIGVSFRGSQLIEHALPLDARRVLHLRITDVTGPAALPLFDSDPALPMAPRGYRFDRDLAYGGRVWRVLMQPLDREPAVIPWYRRSCPLACW